MPLEGFPGVDQVLPILKPYKLVARELVPDPTVIDVNGRQIGDDAFGLIAGPCSVEYREQTLETARVVAKGLSTKPFPILEATIAQMQEAMGSGALTSVQLVNLYLDRIQEIDQDPHGPRLNSIIETNADALAIADLLDRERQQGHLRGPLHGIPILLKDNIDTHDKMTTTAGSLALEGSIPPRDAFVAERLRAAGAVLLGKANMSEWANIRSNKSSSGWSARGGQCRNPYVLDRTAPVVRVVSDSPAVLRVSEPVALAVRANGALRKLSVEAAGPRNCSPDSPHG